MAERLPAQNRSNYRSTCIEDAATQAALQPWVTMECRQLGAGKQLAQMETAAVGCERVVRETQLASVHKLGITPPGFCALSYSTPEQGLRFSDLGGDDGATMFFIPERTEYDLYVPAGAQTSYVTFNFDSFLQEARVLAPAQWECAPQQLLAICNGQKLELMLAITEWLQYSQKLIAAAPVCSFDFNHQMLQQLLLIATAPSSDGVTVSRAERIKAYHTFRKASEFIEICFAVDTVPTISDICRAAGVSERCLQYAFRAYVNMSPLAYLRSFRLSRVRTILRTSCPSATSVTEVAMRFGFLHLGRFARDYKQAFGEHPSITLGRTL